MQAKQTKLMASALSQLDQIKTSCSRTARLLVNVKNRVYVDTNWPAMFVNCH